MSRRLPDLLPWLLLIGALVTTAMLRTVESLAEYDRYVEAAENLLRGDVRLDDFHGFGFPVAVAGLAWLGGMDPFHAGLALAAVSALVTVAAAGAIAERVLPGSRRVAVWLLAANALVWTLGATASADLPAAALLLLGFALALGPLSRWRLAGIGALLGAAVSVHALVVTVALPVALFVAWRTWRARRAAAALLMLPAAALGYLPHLVPCLVGGRSPLGDGWHNLYLKVVCDWDGRAMQQAYDDGALPGMWAFFGEHGGEVLSRGVADALRGATAVLPEMMVGSAAPVPWVAWWLPALAVVLLLATPGARGRGALLVAFAMLQFSAVCVIHQPMTRHLVPTLAVLTIGLAAGLHGLRRRPRVAAGATVLAVAVLLAVAPLQVRRFLALQPEREVEVARSLPERLARPVSLISTYNLIDRYVDYPCRGLVHRGARAYGSAEQTWKILRNEVTRSGMSFVMIGRVTDRRLFAAVTGAPLPDDFAPVHRDEDVLVLEYRHDASDWIGALELTPRPPRRGTACEIGVRLTAVALPALVVSVGAALRGPDGGQRVLTLVRGTDGRYVVTFSPDAAGAWVAHPVVLLADGTVLRGADVEFTVAQ